MTANKTTLSSIMSDDDNTVSITREELEELGFKENGMGFNLYEFFYDDKKFMVKLTNNIITSKIFYIKNIFNKYMIHRGNDLPASLSYRYDIELEKYICFEKDWRLYDNLIRQNKDLPISQFIYPDKSIIFYFFVDKTSNYNHVLQLYEYFNYHGEIKYEFFFMNRRIMMETMQSFFGKIEATSYESLLNFTNNISNETLKLFEIYIE